MKRLFISLYLMLSLSMLGIGWTLDSLWQAHEEELYELDTPLIAFAKLLSTLPEDKQKIALSKINDALTYPIALVNQDQITLFGDTHIYNDRVITSVTDEDTQFQFIAVGDSILMAGPMDIDPRENVRSAFTISFYISLALVALVWVWPLSKDLKTLRSATKKFGEAHWDTRIELNKSSQVRPLADTFNDMAQHISSLIDNQRHLTNAVSHEIRTPLARLKFALALLPSYCQPNSKAEDRQHFLEEMNLDIQEMENLLQELLTYASLEAMQNEPELEKCELIKLSEALIKRIKGLSDIQVTFEYGGLEQVFVKGESSLIDRAIQNLVTNAQRYAKSQVNVSLSIVKEGVILAVSNDGPAIPIEDQPHIFEAFYRSKTQQLGNKGHGLGLAIIKRIMKRHRGDVSLQSDEQATRFTLTWPLVKKV